MTLKRIGSVFFLLLALIFSAEGQKIGFRLAVNSGMFITELGETEVPHPLALELSPALSSDNFTPQPTIGVEGEVLFQISPMSYFGVEVDYTKLKGYNDNPPYYNWYLTPYFDQFQDEYFDAPVAFNTTLINVAVNWKYFFFKNSDFNPFVKLTGVVAFVATDYTYKDSVQQVLYARGTKNSNQRMWPAFHVGGGLGFSYQLSDNWSLQVDGTMTVNNSDIINGVPNFTYAVEEDVELLKYHKRPTLTAQVSAGVVYTIEVEKPKAGFRRGRAGKIDPNLPFYRKKK